MNKENVSTAQPIPRKTFNVAIFTGTRAEYGLMRHLINAISLHPRLQIQLLVSGTHLSQSHGYTFKEIQADKQQPAALIPLKLDDDPQPSMAALAAEVMTGVSKALEQLRSNVLIILGDRYESFAAASAAHMANVPICHLHGGETTKGAIDDRLRHAISQLSTYHFCAAEPYRKRIIEMGHPRENVYNVGPMIQDALRVHKPMDKQEFTELTGFEFGKLNIIATFHPETLKKDFGLQDLKWLIESLKGYNLHILFTMPNADHGNDIIKEAITSFHQEASNCVWLIPSLGQECYLSALTIFDGMVGNSSSGIIEAPLKEMPVLNIGDRQRGRIRFGEVLEAGGSYKSIQEGVKKLLSNINHSSQRQKIICTKQSPTKSIITKLEQLALTGPNNQFI